MKKLKYIIITLVALFSIVALPQVAMADPTQTSPAGQIQSGVNSTGGAGATPLGTQLKNIVNVLLYILGAIAVIMIVVGGIRYVTSGGDSGAVSGAKNTILYSVVGLIVAILAYAIVNFVITAFHA